MVDDIDNIYFKGLLDLVPAHIYFAQEDKEQIRNAVSEGERRKKRQQDPVVSNKISSLQTTLHLNSSPMQDKIKGKKDSKQKKKKKQKKGDSVSSSMQEAQEKLRARIVQLQAKRTQGLSSEEQQEQKRLQRKQRRLQGHGKNKSKTKVKGSEGKVSAALKAAPVVQKPSKPIVTQEGKLVFSKFDFTHSGSEDKVGKEKHASALVGKDYKRLLQRLEQRDAKVAKVREHDLQAAIKLEQKHVWQDVLHKARGERVKDDPKLLRKAMKRKEKMKDQRKNKWDKRSKTVENTQKMKQQERQKNIDKKKEEKKEKQRKKLMKKGHILPGV